MDDSGEQKINAQALSDYFDSVFEIGEFIVRALPRHGVETVENKPSLDGDGAIPFNGAVLLKYAQGCAAALCTPLGRIDIKRGIWRDPKTERELHNFYTEKLGLVEVGFPGADAHSGPYFAVTRNAKGQPLPMPSLEASLSIPPDQATALWDAIKPSPFRRNVSAAMKRGRQALSRFFPK